MSVDEKRKLQEAIDANKQYKKVMDFWSEVAKTACPKGYAIKEIIMPCNNDYPTVIFEPSILPHSRIKSE